MILYRALLGSFFTLFCILPVLSPAQTAEYRWAIQAGAGMAQYLSHPGQSRIATQAYQPVYGIGASKYLAGGFDFRTQLQVAPNISFPSFSEQAITGPMIDMNYLLAFKFNNGVFFRESAFIGPYLLFGVGGSYVPNHPDAYLPLGGGVRFRLSPRMSVQVESMRKISLNKDYQQLANAVAFVYNLGETPDYQQIPTQEVEEELIAALLMPKDSDQDGLADHEDDCPGVKGLASLAGCPTSMTTEDIAATDPVQTEAAPTIEVTPTPLEALQEPVEGEIVAVVPEPVEAEKESPGFTEEEPATLLADAIVPPESTVATEPEGNLPDPAASAMVSPEPTELIGSGLFFDEDPAPVTETAPTPSNNQSLVALIPEEALTVRPETQPGPESVTLPCGGEAADFDPILFAYGSDQLSESAIGQLQELGQQLQSCPDLRLVLEGHTDDIGTENDNLVLSVMRAFNVKYFLVYEMGISQNRILSKGKGEQQPLASNDRRINRRVDFTFVF